MRENNEDEFQVKCSKCFKTLQSHMFFVLWNIIHRGHHHDRSLKSEHICHKMPRHRRLERGRAKVFTSMNNVQKLRVFKVVREKWLAQIFGS